MPEDTYQRAVALVREMGKASVSLLQRKLNLGYGAASRLIDRMEAEGVIAPKACPSDWQRTVIQPR